MKLLQTRLCEFITCFTGILEHFTQNIIGKLFIMRFIQVKLLIAIALTPNFAVLCSKDDAHDSRSSIVTRMRDLIITIYLDRSSSKGPIENSISKTDDEKNTLKFEDEELNHQNGIGQEKRVSDARKQPTRKIPKRLKVKKRVPQKNSPLMRNKKSAHNQNGSDVMMAEESTLGVNNPIDSEPNDEFKSGRSKESGTPRIPKKEWSGIDRPPQKAKSQPPDHQTHRELKGRKDILKGRHGRRNLARRLEDDPFVKMSFEDLDAGVNPYYSVDSTENPGGGEEAETKIDTASFPSMSKENKKSSPSYGHSYPSYGHSYPSYSYGSKSGKSYHSYHYSPSYGSYPSPSYGRSYPSPSYGSYSYGSKSSKSYTSYGHDSYHYSKSGKSYHSYHKRYSYPSPSYPSGPSPATPKPPTSPTSSYDIPDPFYPPGGGDFVPLDPLDPNGGGLIPLDPGGGGNPGGGDPLDNYYQYGGAPPYYQGGGNNGYYYTYYKVEDNEYNPGTSNDDDDDDKPDTSNDDVDQYVYSDSDSTDVIGSGIGMNEPVVKDPKHNPPQPNPKKSHKVGSPTSGYNGSYRSAPKKETRTSKPSPPKKSIPMIPTPPKSQKTVPSTRSDKIMKPSKKSDERDKSRDARTDTGKINVIVIEEIDVKKDARSKKKSAPITNLIPDTKSPAKAKNDPAAKQFDEENSPEPKAPNKSNKKKRRR